MVFIYGHRGASGYELQNTIASYDKALKLKADGIEIDTRPSKDGVWFVSHDDNLKKVSNYHIKISKTNSKELSKLTLNNGEHLPILSKVLKKYDLPINVELKSKQHLKTLQKVLEKNENVLISAFKHNILQKLRAKRKALLVSGYRNQAKYFPAIYINRACAIGAESIHFHARLITKKAIRLAHQKGLKVFVYTINEEKQFRKLIELGIDGIFTNYPDKMRGVLNEINDKKTK